MYIVLGEERGKVKLVSISRAEKRNSPGILPKGSFLTVETENNKHILRVDDSQQNEPYSPAPLLADMDLGPLKQDQKCQNIVYAYRIGQINERTDGKVDFIPPQSKARRSTQEEIDAILTIGKQGAKAFLATVYAGKNQLLKDEGGNGIVISLPDENVLLPSINLRKNWKRKNSCNEIFGAILRRGIIWIWCSTCSEC
jgi:uncharacterized protein